MVELDVAEAMEEELVGIALTGWQVESKTVVTSYGSILHGCSIDDVMKGQSK